VTKIYERDKEAASIDYDCVFVFATEIAQNVDVTFSCLFSFLMYSCLCCFVSGDQF